MTDTDLPAGPKLDFQITSKVMRWRVFTATNSEWRTQLLDQSIQCVQFPSPPVECRRYEGMRFVGTWHPSTDIVDAWEVFTSPRFCYQVIQDTGEGRWKCKLQPAGGGEEFYAFADTAPLAICRAALKVVEEEE